MPLHTHFHTHRAPVACVSGRSWDSHLRRSAQGWYDSPDRCPAFMKPFALLEQSRAFVITLRMVHSWVTGRAAGQLACSSNRRFPVVTSKPPARSTTAIRPSFFPPQRPHPHTCAGSETSTVRPCQTAKCCAATAPFSTCAGAAVGATISLRFVSPWTGPVCCSLLLLVLVTHSASGGPAGCWDIRSWHLSSCLGRQAWGRGAAVWGLQAA